MSQASADGEPRAARPDFIDDHAIDPHREYARLRAECPVAHLVNRGGMQVRVISRYDDAKAALTDPRLLKDPRVGQQRLREAGLAHFFEQGPLSRHMLAADPPEHTRLRRSVAATFTARRTQQLRPRIQQITDELIDAFAGKGEADFVRDFADVLPTFVIAELLGIPVLDRDRFHHWARQIMRPPGDPRRENVEEQFARYLDEQIARKRAAPGDDLVSALLAVPAEDRLTEAELRGSLFLLLVAGYETTTNLLGNGMLALLRHPDQHALLRERPDLVPNAVEEFLRYESPVARASFRFAAEDLEIAGTAIPRGEMVLVALLSANRDERLLPEADRLDITRAPHIPGTNNHLAFGYGVHYCLGAPLARLEAQIAFETLLRRVPDIELAVPVEQLTYRPAALMHGLESLPIRFSLR